MRCAHTVEQIRAAEAALMDTLPPGALMQRAAAGLTVACADYLGRVYGAPVYGARVLILAGSGSNGGDALFAGARLAARGARVEAVLLSETSHAESLAAFRRAGGRVVDKPGPADLVLDGIVGIGGKPGLREAAATLVADLHAPVVSVDVPSGIDVDTGELSGSHVAADVTVTFGTFKVGLLIEPAASVAGQVELVDIGLGPYLGSPAAESLGRDDVRRLLPWPAHDAHKYSRGVLGVAAGSEHYTGAGLLVTAAAVATGLAGMIRYDGASAALVRSAHPEVVIGGGRVQAWAVGSGIGDRSAELVGRILGEELPTVVDADGLRYIPVPCPAEAVLTPHAGELARMLEVPRERVEAGMLEAATAAARRWDAVVLLKGPRSLIAAPDGRVRVNTTGVEWLGTAGAGDVLTGVVGVLLAAGMSGFDAASVGAWVHGQAARLASAGGPISASDVVRAVPEAIRSLVG